MDQREALEAAQRYLKIPSDPAAERAAAKQYALGIVESLTLVPALFWLRFGAVGVMGWGTAVFFAVYCALTAIALTFKRKTKYHTPVALVGDWKDKLGAWWLVACAFGPFFGWIIGTALPVGPGSWRAAYGTRVLLAAVLPCVTALPMLRYARGKSAWVSIPILICVTLIPVSTAVGTAQDLIEGPRAGMLVHTGRPIDQSPGR